MTIRNLGAFDAGLASRVFAARLSEKVLSFKISGLNPDIDSGQKEDVWDFGGNYTYLAAASILEFESDDAQDAPGGTGISRIRVLGMDDNFKLQEELITLNGTTQVLSTLPFLRVFKIVADVFQPTNPTAAFAGRLNVMSGATQVARITAGNTSTHMCLFTVPVNYTGFIDSAYTSGGPGDDFIINFDVRKLDNIFVASETLEVTNSLFASVPFNPAILLAEKSDIKASALATNNNVTVRVSLSVTLLRNDYLQSLAESV